MSVRNKISSSLKGRPSPNKGKQMSDSQKLKISLSMRGKKFTETHKRKISEALSKRTGKLASNYIDGRTALGYSNQFIKIRPIIRKRDNNTCLICSMKYSKVNLEVHHCDKDKHNNLPNNLITLCRFCHSEIHQTDKNWRKECHPR
jgi:hypothetical protein